ncbi:unnamed protein product [Pseudo-nitzschia multistriata]|uniref:AAA+ ATPase domain-containing protein n=1 Tax=Pseudo-nitzschia multistriata TaxID=183589 RepID=A0A448ZSY8_9STRA|nr:unnamed protein product [Pseudo-nitzschia multistriata]
MRILATLLAAAPKVLLLAGPFSLALQDPGRPRGFKSVRREAADYAAHWESLLLEEYHETAEELRDQRKSWSRRRLEQSGISVFGASAEPESEVLGEKIVRFYRKGETMFKDRFTRGDVLVMTPTVRSVDPVPRECLVVDVGSDWITAGVGSSWPDGLWEARKLAGFFEVRLDRTAPRAPLRAQRKALDMVRKGNAGAASALMARTFCSPNDAEALGSGAPSFLGADARATIEDALERAKRATSFEPNPSQEEAIAWALQRKVSLVRGPPGTGKTRVAALLVSTAMRMEGRVLAVTHSNGAADVLLEALLQMGVPAVRLGRPASVSPSVQHRTITAMTERMPRVAELRKRAADQTLERQQRSAAAFELRRCLADVRESIAKTAPVVVASCIGAHQLVLGENTNSGGGGGEDGGDDEDDEMSFATVVLDEAAQTTEPALVCALAASRAEQVVLVGDTRQLPPTVTSMKLRDRLGVSPMSRLEDCGVGETTLRVQYRMPPFLLEHPSEYFYNGLVACAGGLSRVDRPPPGGFPWPSSRPLAFVQVGESDSEIAHNFGGRSNPTEARLVVSIVADLIDGGDTDPSGIAVISPYSKQVQLIRTELSSETTRGRATGGVRVGTVDSFQGQETDVVVFSAVRSNQMKELGFLRDSRRLCVAITRARRGLIVVGDRAVLKTCRHWEALLRSCESRGCCLDGALWNDPSAPKRDHGGGEDDDGPREPISDTEIDEILDELFSNNDDELFAPAPGTSV